MSRVMALLLLTPDAFQLHVEFRTFKYSPILLCLFDRNTDLIALNLSLMFRFKDAAARLLSACNIQDGANFKLSKIHGVKRAYFLKTLWSELSFIKSSSCVKYSAQLRPVIRSILSHFNPIHMFTPRFLLTYHFSMPPSLSSGFFHWRIPTKYFIHYSAYFPEWSLWCIFQHAHRALFSSTITVPYFPAWSLCPIFQHAQCSLFSSMFTVPYFPKWSLCPIFQHAHCASFSSVLIMPYFPACSLCPIFQSVHCALFSSVLTVPYFPAWSLCLIHLVHLLALRYVSDDFVPQTRWFQNAWVKWSWRFLMKGKRKRQFIS